MCRTRVTLLQKQESESQTSRGYATLLATTVAQLLLRKMLRDPVAMWRFFISEVFMVGHCHWEGSGMLSTQQHLCHWNPLLVPLLWLVLGIVSLQSCCVCLFPFVGTHDLYILQFTVGLYLSAFLSPHGATSSQPFPNLCSTWIA